MWRHGDVLIAPVETIPEAAVRQTDGILARGEITGHAHRIAERDSAELWELDGLLFIKVIAPVPPLSMKNTSRLCFPRVCIGSGCSVSILPVKFGGLWTDA